MINQNKMTAVEQFWQDVQDILPSSVDTETGVKLVRAYNQAKEIEKEQMFGYVISCYITETKELKVHKDLFEQWYNETFKPE